MRSRLARAFLGGPASRWDWILFALVAGACYVTFQHGDILTTGTNSLAYLQGHFSDFYDYNASIGVSAAYLPSTYLVFALWNLPLWFLGFARQASAATPELIAVLWYKLLPTLFYFATAVVVARVARQLGLGERKSRLSAFVWLTTPIAFYSQFIFGQYDSLSVFLVLLGLYFYYRKRLLHFAFALGLAFTFKYFSLVLFVPLLLLAEKRPLRILERAAVFIGPALLEIAFYLPSPAFRTSVFVAPPWTGYLWKTTLWTGYFDIQVVPLLWVLTCAWAYFVEPKGTRDGVHWSLYFANISMFLLFGLSMFHPQWLLLATPFWLLSTMLHRKADIFLGLDIAMMLFFILFSVTFHDRDVDQQLFSLGILRRIAIPVLATATPIRDFFFLKDASLPFTLFSALVLIQAVFKHPRNYLAKPSRSSLPSPVLIRTRFLLGIGLFVIPAVTSLVLALNSPPPFFTTAKGEFFGIGPMTTGRSARQVFLAKTATITRIDFLPGKYEPTTQGQLTLRLLDPASDIVLFERQVDAAEVVDATYYQVRLPALRVSPGRRYLLEFEAGNSPGGALTLYRTAISDLGGSHYAVVDGVKQSYDLVIRLYGR